MLRHATLALAFLLAPASALAEIAIGTAGPMDGPLAVFGEELKNGAAQAVADINARGGVLGEPLRLEAGDDKCDGETATAIANQMVGKGIALMAGHFCSFASIPASLVYNQAKVVQITPASPHPKFTDQRPGPGIFRICGRDDQQGAVAGAFIASRFADRNVAVIDDKSAYGKGLADRTRTAMNGAGKKELFTDSYDPGSKDFSELVSRLKAASVGLVFIAGFPSDVAAIAREMKAQAVSATIMGGDTLMTDEYWQAAGDAVATRKRSVPPACEVSTGAPPSVVSVANMSAKAKPAVGRPSASTPVTGVTTIAAAPGAVPTDPPSARTSLAKSKSEKVSPPNEHAPTAR